jgi:hypothetical protein
MDYIEKFGFLVGFLFAFIFINIGINFIFYITKKTFYFFDLTSFVITSIILLLILSLSYLLKKLIICDKFED